MDDAPKLIGGVMATFSACSKVYQKQVLPCTREKFDLPEIVLVGGLRFWYPIDSRVDQHL